jgi:2'-5' RNA ligase
MEELSSIRDAFSGIGSKVKDINLTTFGISTFGKPPSVVYLEIIDKENKGKLLAEEICRRLKATPDKPWAAHITLARIRSYNKKFNVSHLKNIKFKPIVFSPTSVTIFTSKLTPKGPNYTVFHKC